MKYFAYGSNLNTKAVAEWCRAYGIRPPAMSKGKQAVLDNYRLCFPIFSEYWSGGIADIVYDPGKYVSGAVFTLSDTDMEALDQKVGRRLDANGKEVGVYRRVDVTVSPLTPGERIQVVTYQGLSNERYHIPPTQNYMDQVIQGAYGFGLSMMWISYLQSFSTQASRSPRVPPNG